MQRDAYEVRTAYTDPTTTIDRPPLGTAREPLTPHHRHRCEHLLAGWVGGSEDCDNGRIRTGRQTKGRNERRRKRDDKGDARVMGRNNGHDNEDRMKPTGRTVGSLASCAREVTSLFD
jgi:hypothetical protein